MKERATPELPELAIETLEGMCKESVAQASVPSAGAPPRLFGAKAVRAVRTTIVLGVMLFFWELVVQARLFSRVFVPAPKEVLTDFVDLWLHGFFNSSLLQNIEASLMRVSVGFATAVVIGVPLGLMMARSNLIFDIVDPILEFVRPVPPLAYIPLLVVWFGIGELPKVILIMVGTLPMVILSSVAGVRGTPIQRVRVAQCMGATEWQIFRHVYLPSSLPEIFTGLRVGIGIAWSCLVAAEIIAAYAGLGWMIQIAGREIQMGIIVIGIMLIGVLGYGMDLGIRVLERLIVPWRGHAGF